jgi:hypothetical protein
MVVATTPPDIYGFAAVILMAASALYIVFRGKILKHVRNLSLLRALHVAVSMGAGIFLILHVTNYITFPLNDGILIGYGAFAMAVAVWISGMAFIQRAKDSLHFHAFLSLALIALILIHASSSGLNIPLPVSELMIGGSSVVIFADLLRYRTKAR